MFVTSAIRGPRRGLHRRERLAGQRFTQRTNALERHTPDRIVGEFEVGAADVVVVVVPALGQRHVSGQHVEPEPAVRIE